MHNQDDLHDLLTHFADEFRATADLLKKARDLKDYKFLDSKSNEQSIKTIEDLKKFLKAEIEAYADALSDI